MRLSAWRSLRLNYSRRDRWRWLTWRIMSAHWERGWHLLWRAPDEVIRRQEMVHGGPRGR